MWCARAVLRTNEGLPPRRVILVPTARLRALVLAVGASLVAMTDAAPLAGHINVALGRGELPTATLTHPASGASCEVVLAGAHVTSWKTADGIERLFVSSASGFGAGAAIRGGIPVCWPQFSGRGSLPKHGFVRTSSEWEIAEMTSDEASTKLVLVRAHSRSAPPTRRHRDHANLVHSVSGLRRAFATLRRRAPCGLTPSRCGTSSRSPAQG